ncbi:MAG: alpha/beta fold hydrolase, partial [Deltaproteobacteria bacterium]|nr:alpha/beta fold hydrolase [Deltaproteobacteria bacterium]
ISVPEAVDITCAIASALSHAHTEGVVHCDVKPANILLDHSGTPFLADFGIARFTDEQRPEEDTKVLGTPAFMAPEQRQGEPTAKSDQYSLAKTFLVMLGGDLAMHPARAILALPAELFDAFGSVLSRALAGDPDERFPDVSALAGALREIDVVDTEAATRLAPILRDASGFRWAAGRRSLERFGEHIFRARYMLSDLASAGVFDESAIEAFRAATGYDDFSWSLYARDERLGPLDDPLALARAKQTIVLLHGLFTSGDLWQDVAVGIARDNGMAVALVPDVVGFGESRFGTHIPPGTLEPAGLVRTMNAWLQLIGLDGTPTVVMGHSYAASALLCARETDLGPGVHRICLTPALFFFRWHLRLKARLDALMAIIVFGTPQKIRSRIARILFRRDASLARTHVGVRDDMARSALRLGGLRVATLFWALAGARPAPPEELRACTVVTTPDDPLVSADLARESFSAAGLPDSQWYRLVYGGHFPQLVDDDHPEWVARNVHELVSLVDGVLDRAHTTARRKGSKETPPARGDTSAPTV